MPDTTPRVAPRSAGAIVDFELLRVARTDFGEPETVATMTIGERIRGLAVFRAVRPSDSPIDGSSPRRES